MATFPSAREPTRTRRHQSAETVMNHSLLYCTKTVKKCIYSISCGCQIISGHLLSPEPAGSGSLTNQCVSRSQASRSTFQPPSRCLSALVCLHRLNQIFFVIIYNYHKYIYNFNDATHKFGISKMLLFDSVLLSDENLVNR